MLDMAARKRTRPDSEGEKPQKPNRKGVAMTVWLPADLMVVLEEWISSQPARPSKTEVVKVSLTAFLRAQGVRLSDDTPES